MSDTVHLVVCMAAMCGLRYLIRPGPALVSLVGSSERRWEQVLSLCQGGKEGRLYMSPLAVGRASGTPPGLSCRCKVPETFCDRADTSPKQLTNKQTNIDYFINFFQLSNRSGSFVTNIIEFLIYVI